MLIAKHENRIHCCVTCSCKDNTEIDLKVTGHGDVKFVRIIQWRASMTSNYWTKK